MILRLLLQVLRFALYLFELVLIVYTVYPLFSKVRGVFYQTLATICEPMLIPIRRFLSKHLPQKWLRVDWSPAVAVLLCGLANMLLSFISLVF